MEYTSEVAVAVKRSPAEALNTALSRLSEPILPPKNSKQVIIKPSIYDPSLPGNTDVQMVRAAVRMFKSLGPVKIVESDNPLRTTTEAFTKSGYNSLIQDNVELVNLSDVDMGPTSFSGHQLHALSASPALALRLRASLSPRPFLLCSACISFHPEWNSRDGERQN